MNVYTIANDYGEAECLRDIGHEFRRQNHNVLEYLGRGGKHIFTNELRNEILKTDLLVSAISENCEIEVLAAKALRLHKPSVPIAVYAPGNNAYSRETAKPLRDIADILMVSYECEIPGAKNLYSNAKAVKAIGNLLHERFHPSMTMSDARKVAGVSETQKLIFVPGDKFQKINIPLFQLTIDAAGQKKVAEQYPIVAIGVHPGDEIPGSPKIYDRFLEHNPSVPVKIFTRNDIPSTTLVTACDLIVTSVSTLATAAAFQRKPIIGVFFKAQLGMLTEGQRGKQFIWEHEHNKTAKIVESESVHLLTKAIFSFLAEDGYSKFRPNQEKHYPTPPILGSTAKKAVDIILQYV